MDSACDLSHPAATIIPPPSTLNLLPLPAFPESKMQAARWATWLSSSQKFWIRPDACLAMAKPSVKSEVAGFMRWHNLCIPFLAGMLIASTGTGMRKFVRRRFETGIQGSFLDVLYSPPSRFAAAAAAAAAALLRNRHVIRTSRTSWYAADGRSDKRQEIYFVSQCFSARWRLFFLAVLGCFLLQTQVAFDKARSPAKRRQRLSFQHGRLYFMNASVGNKKWAWPPSGKQSHSLNSNMVA